MYTFFLYCIFKDFKGRLQEFEDLELQINGVKERTAKGYAIKDIAVWWLFKKFPESMDQAGYLWEEYLEVIMHLFCFECLTNVFSTCATNKKSPYKLYIKN